MRTYLTWLLIGLVVIPASLFMILCLGITTGVVG
jgi:hypothetical protein